MDERTLTALKGSIAKWEGIVAGTVEDEGPANCPLCVEFYSTPSHRCVGCPVHEHTGEAYCTGTPYEHYDAAMEIGNPRRAARAAKAELDFLRSLLPVSDHQSAGEASAAVSEADGPQSR